MLCVSYLDVVVHACFNFGRLISVHVNMMPALGLKCEINFLAHEKMRGVHSEPQTIHC